MRDAPAPDTDFTAVARRAPGRARRGIARAVVASAIALLAGTATTPTARAATSDLLVVLGADGRSHVVEHTLSSDGTIVRLELADDAAPQPIRFSGPERATFAEAQRRSPTWVSLWSGSAIVRYRHRYGDVLERDAADTFRLRVPSVPEGLSIEDGEPVHSSLTWALPEEFEILSFGGGEGRGRWIMIDGMLTFEQRDIVPVALDIVWRRRKTGQLPFPSPPSPALPEKTSSAAEPCAEALAPGKDCTPKIIPSADTDADGVPDHRDVCLDDARPMRVDGFGCRVSDGVGHAGLVLEGIEFPAGKSYLDAGARAALDRVARALLAQDDEHGEDTYEIAAHTDGAGSRARNLGLSARRAEAVRHYLMLRGVGPNRLRARGYGEARPLADDGTATGRRTNRRIELARTAAR